MKSLRDALEEAALSSSFTLDPALTARCVSHHELLVRWNATHNLTRVLSPEEAARRHYLDCLVPLALLTPPAGGIADLGSGAGFPGLMAAMTWPDVPVFLVEPSRKRASFLRLAAAQLGLPRVEVREMRAEASAPAPLVLSRATFSDRASPALLERVIPGGTLAMWGGPQATAEVWRNEAAAAGAEDAERLPYQVDGLEARALLVARRPS
jgi:16S rRNA (guanine527-N7)-methyltransferase